MSMLLAAQPKATPLEWIFDTGAAQHMLTRRDAAPYRRDRSQPDMHFAGVGGNTSSDGRALIKKFGGLGFSLSPWVYQGDMNLLSGETLCEEQGVDYIRLGSRGLPPYIILPSGKAIVLDVVGGVPVYEQNNPRFDP